MECKIYWNRLRFAKLLTEMQWHVFMDHSVVRPLWCNCCHSCIPACNVGLNVKHLLPIFFIPYCISFICHRLQRMNDWLWPWHATNIATEILSAGGGGSHRPHLSDVIHDNPLHRTMHSVCVWHITMWRAEQIVTSSLSLLTNLLPILNCTCRLILMLLHALYHVWRPWIGYLVMAPHRLF